MSHPNSHIICLDIEATCWADGNRDRKDGKFSEIIEIGICQINTKTLEIEDPQSIYVRPIRTELSQYCIDLTGITDKILEDKGITLNQAWKKIHEEYNPGLKPWAGWGEYDYQMVISSNDGIPDPYNIPLHGRYINAKQLYSLVFGIRKNLGLYKALKHSNLEPIGTHHSGKDDAFNMARIIIEICKKLRN